MSKDKNIKDIVSINTLTANVVQATHLETAVAKEAVLATLGGIRYASVGTHKILATVGSDMIELKGVYTFEDLRDNVVAGSQVSIDKANQVIGCVGQTVFEHLAHTKTVDVEELGTFETDDELIYFNPSHYSS